MFWGFLHIFVYLCVNTIELASFNRSCSCLAHKLAVGLPQNEKFNHSTSKLLEPVITNFSCCGPKWTNKSIWMANHFEHKWTIVKYCIASVWKLVKLSNLFQMAVVYLSLIYCQSHPRYQFWRVKTTHTSLYKRTILTHSN